MYNYSGIPYVLYKTARETLFATVLLKLRSFIDENPILVLPVKQFENQFAAVTEANAFAFTFEITYAQKYINKAGEVI